MNCLVAREDPTLEQIQPNLIEKLRGVHVISAKSEIITPTYQYKRKNKLIL